MSLPDLWLRIKGAPESSLTESFNLDPEGRVEENRLTQRLFLPLFILLVATLSFGLGRLSQEGTNSGIEIKYDPSLSALIESGGEEAGQATALKAVEALEKTLSTGVVVASKNGSKYHYPHCPGAKQIKEENKVEFASAQDAEASGYTLAGNCKPR